MSEQQKAYRREVYAWRKEHHICVECGKEDALPGSVKCLQCKMIRREQEQRRYEQHKNDAEWKAKKLEKQRLYYKQTREQHKCIRCFKPIPESEDNGQTLCKRCSVIVNRNERNRTHALGVLPKDMCGNGTFCAVCSKPVEEHGKKLCNKCYETCCNNLSKARANLPYDCTQRRQINAIWQGKANARKERLRSGV